MESGTYLVVQFSFPKPFQAEYGEKARALHQVLEGQDWIEEVFAASGGIGAGPSSIWVFKLNDYSALDRLLGGEDPVSKAYVDFFGAMEDVRDFIREEVVFA
ncbi:MAG: hypothetical protein PVG14_02385 [Anaerolineales bacterium]|jgi:hypothetical protein